MAFSWFTAEMLPSVTEAVMSVRDLGAGRAQWNPRVMPENEAAALKNSIERFGLVEPLIWNVRTRRLVGGHQRLDALIALGEQSTKVMQVDLDEGDERALNLALNKIHGQWDWAQLDALLADMQANHPDSLGHTGFTEDELQRIRDDGSLMYRQLEDAKAEVRAVEAAEAEVQDPTVTDGGPVVVEGEPTTRLGQLWQLGQHRLLCGDSTDAATIERLMQGQRAQLLATDPPYCVDYTGDDRPGGKDWSDRYDERAMPGMDQLVGGALRACLPCTDQDSAIYMWHAGSRFGELKHIWEGMGLLLHQTIIWVKPSSPISYCYFRWRHEPCAFGWRRGHKPPHRIEQQTDTVWEDSTVWYVDWDGKSKLSGFHPTSKPPKLFEIPMALHTRPGDLVLEPFCGSGSQIIAAERMGRRCRAVELEPRFVDGAIRRWELATGQKACLIE